MTIPVTQQDVEDRLRRSMTNDEIAQMDGVAAEAGAQVEGHLMFTYADTDTVPAAVTIVTSRIVARVFNTPSSVQDGTTSRSASMGPLSATTQFLEGATNGGPWLSKLEKAMLNPYAARFNCMPVTRA